MTGSLSYAQMLEAGRDAAALVVDVDDGRILEASPNAARTLGWTPATLSGCPVDGVFPDAQRVEILQFLRQHLEHGGVQLAALTLRRADGREFQVEARVRPLGGSEARAVVLDFTVGDAGDRLRIATERLAAMTPRGEGEKLLQEIVDTLATTLECAWAFVARPRVDDPQRMETLCSSRGGQPAEPFSYRLAGSPCEVALGRQVCIWPDAVQQAFPNDRALVDMGIRAYLGTPLHGAGGQPLGLLVALDTRPLGERLDAAGAVMALYAQRIAGELDRAQAERARAENAHLLTALLDRMDNAVVAIDAEGRCVFSNRLYRDQWRIDAAYLATRPTLPEIIRKTVESGLFPADQLDRYLAARQEQIRTGDPNATLRVPRTDDLVLETHASPLSGGGHLLMFRDVTELSYREARLQYERTHDEITGLPNRTLLEERLDLVPVEAGGATFLLLLDLDRFTLINERFGFRTGDEVLREVARRLDHRAGASATVARLSGGRFAVLAAVAAEGAAAELAQGLQEAVRAPLLAGGSELHTTASIGYAMARGERPQLDGLLREAETALDHAKREGRDACVRFETQMLPSVIGSFEMGEALRHAIDAGELRLHFQPLVDLRCDTLVGIEALVRWARPGHGLLPPVVFLEEAERMVLDVAIGRWVLEAACKEVAALRESLSPHVPVTVNLSRRHFFHPGLVEEIQAVLERSGLSPCSLELDIAEKLISRDMRRALPVMRRLADLGVHLCIDEFGMTPGGFGNLRALPAYRVKIDAALVRGLGQDNESEVLAKALMQMAHGHGIKVLAEGVETVTQMRQLVQLGCDELQGNLCSAPVAADRLHELWREGDWLPVKHEGTERTLLVVDDEGEVLEALKRLFRREGCRVITAGSGSEALERLADERVGVVIADLRMPGLSGTELLARIRECYPEVQRIALSGYAHLESLSSAINEGAVHSFFPKPWDPEGLRRAVRKAFEEGEHVRAARAHNPPASGTARDD